jgi:hypothetical protein
MDRALLGRAKRSELARSAHTKNPVILSLSKDLSPPWAWAAVAGMGVRSFRASSIPIRWRSFDKLRMTGLMAGLGHGET